MGMQSRQQQREAADRRRGTSAERGYDSTWRALRIIHLNASPLCVFHLERGEYVAATIADHIESVRDAPERRLDPTNIQSLCKPCHDRVRQQEQAAERRGKPPAKPLPGAARRFKCD